MFDFVGSMALGIVLLIVGFVLAAVEMFVPGFSVPGICAAVCFVVSILLCASTVWQAVAMIAIIAVVVTVMFVIVATVFAKGKIKSPIQLKDEIDGVSGSDLSSLLGARGVAITDLRPVGTADFMGEELEVMSQGKYISSGTELVVVKVSMNKLLVKPASECAE